MTENDWLTCADPKSMLGLAQEASDRKLRLFAVACHERIWHLLKDKRVCRKTMEFAERYADGLATTNELHGRAWGNPGDAFSVVLYKAREAADNSVEFGAGTVKESVLRSDPDNYKRREEVFKAAWENHRLGEAMKMAEAAMPTEWMGKGEVAWIEERNGQCHLLRDIFGPLPFRSVRIDSRWLPSRVASLAQAIYDDRRFDRLTFLSDALQDAGCDNQELLAHLREPGPHVRGCWALDLILGKE